MKKLTVNKKGLLVLTTIFCFMLVLNMMKPLSSDDYFIAFVWPQGMGINGSLSEAAKRVSSFTDIFESLKAYYFVWGGRIPGQSLMTFFVWQGKEIFNVLNAFVFMILIAEIYWLSHEGKVSFDFDPSFVFWIFFALWAFNISFKDSFLWLSGSCEYMWMLVILLAFLIPYVRNYYDREFLNEDNWFVSIGMFLLGIIAGDSRETVICWIIMILSFWLFRSYKKGAMQRWKMFGLLGLCVGYAVLIFAPGNLSRLAIQQHSDSLFIFEEILIPKLIESIAIIGFHLFLWYFILKFIYVYESYKRNELLNERFTAVNLYLNFIKACAVVAFGSGFLMFLIQSEAFRPSFVNLVFLIIAASSIFRLCNRTSITIIPEAAKRFLKRVGYIYLILTVSCSLWGNYLNWQQWNSVLALVKKAQQNNSVDVLEIAPCPVREKNPLMLLSGFHIIVMPFSGEYETDSIKRTFARYYNIKGIKVSK
jgi:hypothetical protein